jgi:hypothetical protein
MSYFDAPSQDKEARRTNQNNTAIGLDRPLSFRNDLHLRVRGLAIHREKLRFPVDLIQNQPQNSPF